MPVITLTTDFGTKDHYTALVKGAALRRIPEVCIVDISHNIQDFNIVQAAYVFRNSWAAFPEGTVHFITVNDLPKAARQFLLMTHQGHFFIAPDNGILPMALGRDCGTGYSLPWPQDSKFPLADLLGHSAAQLAVGLPPEEGTACPA